MTNSVKKVLINYDHINESNTFSSGDLISGRIILEITKEVTIKSLVIKAKGKTVVRWQEGNTAPRAIIKYFKLEQYIMREHIGKDINVVAAGIHEYPFTFQIPKRNMPGSFKGAFGKNIYTLESRLSRSMQMAMKTKTEFTFISVDKSISSPGSIHSAVSLLMQSPQSGTIEKRMSLFTKGTVFMRISTEKSDYMQGESIRITAEIRNGSSRTVVPKFSLYQKQIFFAWNKRQRHINQILKEDAEPVPSSTHQIITKVLMVPPGLTASILSCPILKVEYGLKVYLDIPMARNPEIKLPLAILLAADRFGPNSQESTV